MEYYNYNIKVIESAHPVIWSRMKEELNDITLDAFGISTAEARDGSLSLCVVSEGQTIRLNSAYRPLEEAKKWAEAFDFPNINTVVEMYGLGNGVFVREVIKKLKEEDSLIIFEPSLEVFLFCIHNFDFRDILSNTNVFLFVQGINEMDLKDILRQKIHWYNVDFQQALEHPQYTKLFCDKAKLFYEELRINNELAIINRNTDAFLGKLTIKNIFKNMPYLIGSNLINEIGECIPKNVPAIIVSAGPSLSKNIAELKEAKGKAVIIAVDSALPFLEEKAIEPDVIVTIDPRKSIRHFNGSYARKLPIISKIEAKPEVFQQNTGRKLFYSSHSYIDKLYDLLGVEVEDYNTGGSVATAAFSVCATLQVNKIILVGQDLAYEGEYTHVGGRKENFNRNVTIKEVEGIDGAMVKTRADWFVYLQWFENAIRTKPEIECIDATEGGAKIKGAKIMSLKEAIDLYCEEKFDFANALRGINPTLSQDDIKKVSEYLHNSYEDLESIRKKSEEILRMVHKIISTYKTKGINSQVVSLTSKITNISSHIEGMPIYAILDTYMSEFSRNNMQNIYRMDSRDGDDTMKTFLLTRDMYENLINATKEIEPLLKQAVEDYDQRMERLKR